ncbi:MAG: hypothetical protein JWM04_1308 [Verrucomicrobiales bacterium]|nr:hypothetical protein [Verrucomicrobiales bacterium]
MTERLPVGIVVPTRNSRQLLTNHLQMLKGLESHVFEVVAVDSESTDGTLELLEQHEGKTQWTALAHPRGLYQSWNFGISRVTAPYTYISTVGDSITLEGLQHLVRVAEKFQADVVISKPDFVSEGGEKTEETFWPIDDILTSLRINQPVLLSRFEAFVFAMVNTGGAILGSSASNLYRTSMLKSRPFPVNFGTVGDGGWGMMNSFEARIAVTPEKFSTFLHHEKSYSLEEYRVNDLPLKLLKAAREALERRILEHPEELDLIKELRLMEMANLEESALICQMSLEKVRNSSMPWILNPEGWRARARRVTLRKQLGELKREALARLQRT